MMLRKSNNALEFSIQAKDELITQLQADLRKARSGGGDIDFDEKMVKLQTSNERLVRALEKEQNMNEDLKAKCDQLATFQANVQKTPVHTGPSQEDLQVVLDQNDSLNTQIEQLQAKMDKLAEKDKASRHKAGQVFLDTLKQPAKKKVLEIYLQDDQAVARMLKEIDEQCKGDLTNRCKKVGHPGTDRISAKQFSSLIVEGLAMDQNDLISILKVSQFSILTAKDQSMKIETLVANINSRIEDAKMIRQQIVKKIATLMLNQKITLEGAVKYFDSDGSGTVSRDELNEGFKRMKVVLNEALIKNLFTILDEDGNDEISVDEFVLVFAETMGTQKAPDANADQFDRDAENLGDVQQEYPLMKQMSLSELNEIEDERIANIMNQQLENTLLSGELVIELKGYDGLILVPSKFNTDFLIKLPVYDDSGAIIPKSLEGKHSSTDNLDANE